VDNVDSCYQPLGKRGKPEIGAHEYEGPGRLPCEACATRAIHRPELEPPGRAPTRAAIWPPAYIICPTELQPLDGRKKMWPGSSSLERLNVGSHVY
jgi:hypothetical protein